MSAARTRWLGALAATLWLACAPAAGAQTPPVEADPDGDHGDYTYDASGNPTCTYGTTVGGYVNIHRSTVAFTAPIPKIFTAAPPRLALLSKDKDNITGTISDGILQGYLLRAGLQYTGAQGCPSGGVYAADTAVCPNGGVSGDIYDVARLDEDHVAFFVADAVGHGMPAALLTIFIKRTLETKEILPNGGYRIIPPDEALAHLNNELLSQQLSLCQFVTMIYGILNTKTRTLSWARAGHPLPFLLKTNGEAGELDLDGALLGVFPNEQFPLQTVQLAPGDSVLMYSDGFESAFTDPFAGSNGGLINDRYRLEFSKLAGKDPHARFAAMVGQLDHQEGSLHQRDDLTALMMTIGE